MTIAVIGNGSIAGYVAAQLRRSGDGPIAFITRDGSTRAQTVPDAAYVGSVAELPSEVTLLIDCAGHSGLAAHGPDALKAGLSVITLSLGALADETLATELQIAAKAGGSRLHLASGAIGALDALRAASVGEIGAVRYTGRKPPKGWLGSPAENILNLTDMGPAPATHFDGTARDAALTYPKNANVAAAVALAGIGFDDTKVELIADPGITANIHVLEAEGAFGTFRFEISGRSLPDNPKSSALAAMSAVAAVRQSQASIGF